jgi:dihydroorotate dehydrogenase electron transfer subunit
MPAPARAAAAPRVSWRQTSARVARHRDAGAGHLWLDLELPGDFPAPEPGQFVQLLLAPPSPVLLPRPMSVAATSLASGARVLGFLYAPVGVGTHALARLVPDDRVDVLGPLGHGFPLDEPGTPVLVAGGRGIAPLLFAAEALGARGRRCELLFGARDRDHLVALDDARSRLGALGGELHLATDDGSAGERGTVVALLERLASRLGSSLVIHACGPHGMLGAIARWALERDTRAWLAMESVMACGTGVCRGCPLPRSTAARARYLVERGEAPSLEGNLEYAMCCTEGPVFEARDLDWEQVE